LASTARPCTPRRFNRDVRASVGAPRGGPSRPPEHPQVHLRAALSARFTAVGVWGGTVMSERRHLVPRWKDNESIDRFKPANRDELRTIEEAAQLLERTFEARRRVWKRRERERTAAAAAMREALAATSDEAGAVSSLTRCVPEE
jgi:hypothetical protein